MRIMRAAGTSGGGGGPTQARNDQRVNEFLGFGVAGVGSGTTVPSNASTNTKGASVSLGTFTNAIAKVELQITVSNGGRYIVELSDDNFASSIKVENFLFSTTASMNRFEFPVKFAAGATVHARVQSSVADATTDIVLIGKRENGIDAPGFTRMVGLNLDLGNTRAAAPNIAVAAAPSWVELIASTAEDYGAVGFAVTESTVAPVAEYVRTQFGIGAASEVAFWDMRFAVAASGLLVPRATQSVIEVPIPAASRIAVKGHGATGGYNLRAAMYGYVL